jgi:hypothetical protein
MELVADPQVEAALREMERALDAADAVALVPVDGRDAYPLARRLEGIGRRVSSHQLVLIGDIDRRRLHAEDGHRSARGLVAVAADLSPAEAGRRAKAARMLRDLPAVAASLRAGRLGCGHVDLIARVHANRRVRTKLVAADADLAVVAEAWSYEKFAGYLRRWEYLADEDGAADRAERDHRRRDFSIHQNLDGSYRIAGGCGSLQGTVASAVFEAYVRAELEADWAEARGRVGDDATFDELARSDAQRRMDAVERIFLDAAANRAEATGHQLVTDLVIDQETFERTAARMVGHDPGTDPRLADWWSDLAADAADAGDAPDDEGAAPGAGATASCVSESEASVLRPATLRSGTIEGRHVDPTEIVAATLVGYVRRVVYGAKGVVIDVGRVQRLFTGPRRLAVVLASAACLWPGCTVPASRCQADHLEPWHQGGSTSPGNGAPACGKHNRFRNHGFTVHRDARGDLHVHRPDGSRIA